MTASAQDGSSGGADLLSAELLARIRSVLSEGDTVRTVANGKPNRVVGIGPDGLLVETERSRGKGAGPQLVPAALINQDWDRLRSTGWLRLGETSHRGSFNCALLSLFPDVEIHSSRPITLRFTGHSG